MIKKLLVAIMIALPALGFAQAKFGVVNTATIFQDLPDVKTATDQMQQASQKLDAEYKNLTDEFNKKYEEFQKLTDETPQVIRERHMNDIQTMSANIEKFRENASQDLQRQQEQLFAPIQQKITDAIQAVGKENNFTFIFENQVAVYVGTDVIDVTAMVRQKLGI